MWQSIGDISRIVRSYHSGYSQLNDEDSFDEYTFWSLKFWKRNCGFKIQEWKLKHSLCLLLGLFIILCGFGFQKIKTRIVVKKSNNSFLNFLDYSSKKKSCLILVFLLLKIVVFSFVVFGRQSSNISGTTYRN